MCEAKFYAKNYCPKCNSINLTPLNQGVDRLAEEIKTFLKEKNIPTFALKQEHPEEKSLAIINDFNLAEKGIILGTSYLFKPQLAKVKNVAAINLDNLFYLPDFKTEEKILSLLIKLKSLSTKNFFIKTTVKDHPLFEIIKNHDFESFWQDELLLRKRYLFPPFSQIIQISNKNKSKERAQQELEASFEKITKTIQKNKLEKKFATTSVCPNYHEKINDTYF